MWVFILPGAVNVYNVIIARSFFRDAIPEELHDAAQVDGLGYFRYFMKIVLPLSSAIIAVIALYYFVGHWNDFFTGLIYIRNQEKQPLQNVLQNILLANQMTTSGGGSDGRSMPERQQAADQIKYGIIIVSTLPLLVVYPFLQKYFNKGVMIGAVRLIASSRVRSADTKQCGPASQSIGLISFLLRKAAVVMRQPFFTSQSQCLLTLRTQATRKTNDNKQ